MKTANEESIKVRVDRMIEQLIALVPNRQEAEILAKKLRSEFLKSQEKGFIEMSKQLSSQQDVNHLRSMTNNHT